MNERIHQVLDGELARDQLTREEQAMLADYEATIAAASHALPRHVAPDLTARVMARVGALDADRPTLAQPAKRSLRHALGWLWTPRTVSLRPAWGLGLAAAAIAALVLMPRPSEVSVALTPQAATGAAPAPAPAQIYVHFRLDAPDASSVHLAGDFTDWQPAVELHEAQPGVWTAIVPVRAGVHEYAFVIDGERWTPDPLGTSVDDGFGGQNSRLSVLPPERIEA
ncbi:MAG TPA: glycogen-binding domain-containing protein [Longimicrobiales bacterium]